MKVKMLVAMAVTGLLAASLTYADSYGNGSSPSSGAVSGTDALNGDSGTVSGTGAMGGTMNHGSSPTTGNNGNVDQGSSDTATGDDDY